MQRRESHSHHHARGVHGDNYADLLMIDLLFGTFIDPAGFAPQQGYYERASARIAEMVLGHEVTTQPHSDALHGPREIATWRAERHGELFADHCWHLPMTASSTWRVRAKRTNFCCPVSCQSIRFTRAVCATRRTEPTVHAVHDRSSRFRHGAYRDTRLTHAGPSATSLPTRGGFGTAPAELLQLVAARLLEQRIFWNVCQERIEQLR